ncbi:MAG: metal-dependent transcriptional regulator [Chloroflexi bacterium]|nr:metal-dependent transcriptional regulator [Chloroflexota bacterium]
MSDKHMSRSAEMYLKAMAEMGPRQAATVSRLAERLSVTQVSANEMVRRLDEQGLVTHKPYKGISLTLKGRQAAGNVLRRQRLWECFLYDHLHIEWAHVYEFACLLEHATAPEVTEALAEFLGNPTTCPRGNPIPATDGTFSPVDGIPLSSAAVGVRARLLAVTATDTEVLKYLQDRHLLPGREVILRESAPMQGPLTLEVEGREFALGMNMAEMILIQPLASH